MRMYERRYGRSRGQGVAPHLGGVQLCARATLARFASMARNRGDSAVGSRVDSKLQLAAVRPTADRLAPPHACEGVKWQQCQSGIISDRHWSRGRVGELR